METPVQIMTAEAFVVVCEILQSHTMFGSPDVACPAYERVIDKLRSVSGRWEFSLATIANVKAALEKLPPPRLCQNCGREFRPSTERAVFCTRRCADTTGTRRRRAKKKESEEGG